MNIKVLRANSALTIVRCIGLITCAALIISRNAADAHRTCAKAKR